METRKSSELNRIIGNKIYLFGDIDDSIMEKVVPEMLQKIDELKNEKDPHLDIYIDSNGGFYNVTFSFLNVMNIARENGIHINSYIMSSAFSGASLIACYADTRYMNKYGIIGIHYGTAHFIASTRLQSDRVIENVKEHFNTIEEVYLENSNISLEEIKEYMRDEQCQFNAETALKLGLIDEIQGINNVGNN